MDHFMSLIFYKFIFKNSKYFSYPSWRCFPSLSKGLSPTMLCHYFMFNHFIDYGNTLKNIAWLCDVDNYHKHDGNYAKCGDNDFICCIIWNYLYKLLTNQITIMLFLLVTLVKMSNQQTIDISSLEKFNKLLFGLLWKD